MTLREELDEPADAGESPIAPPAAHPDDTARRELIWSRVRWGLFAVYLIAILIWSVRHHVETGRVQLMCLAVVGVGISVLGRGWRPALQLVLDWVPFALVLMLYDSTRGLVTTLGIGVHETDVVRAEEWIFGDVPAVWLQDRLYDASHVHWYDAVCTLVYTSHFIATPALAAVLWVCNRERWKAFITRVIALSIAGLITYTAFPEAPPWMASRDGHIGSVLRLSARGWEYLHVHQFHDLVSRAQGNGSNPVAAMPSLHLAFSVIVAAALIRGIRSRWRWLLVLYPALMGFTLVYTGEHYVIDLIAGVVYALAIDFSVPVVARWWRRRRRPSTVPSA